MKLAQRLLGEHGLVRLESDRYLFQDEPVAGQRVAAFQCLLSGLGYSSAAQYTDVQPE